VDVELLLLLLLHGAEFAVLRSQQRRQLHACGRPVSFPLPLRFLSPSPGRLVCSFLQRRDRQSGEANLFQRPWAPAVLAGPGLGSGGL
jgi:hypothetical protein